jgi:hypothetical protein
MTLVAKSFQRYNGGVRAKRLYGSSTITRFYVFRPEDRDDPNKWVIVETGGPSPGERATAAKAKGEEMLRTKGLLGALRAEGFHAFVLPPPGSTRRKVLVVGGLAATAAIVALLLATPTIIKRTSAARASRPLPVVPGLHPQYVALAAKWASFYGVPLQWVLATILAESGGNANAVGDFHVDPQGASIGLMQVNSTAHGSALAAQGLSRQSLFDPDINIQWGTKILRKCVDRVQAALAGRSGDVGLMARLCYTGALRGTDTTSCPTCQASASKWNQKLAQTSAAA